MFLSDLATGETKKPKIQHRAEASRVERITNGASRKKQKQKKTQLLASYSR